MGNNESNSTEKQEKNGIYNFFEKQNVMNEVNEKTEIDEIDEIDEKDKNDLIIKLYIVGTGEKKQYIIDNIFKEEITDENLIKQLKITKRLKTDQFHWAAHIYEDGIINDNMCQEISDEIKGDRKKKENETIMVKSHIILCFGNENTEIISKYFKRFRKSIIIFVTETECKLDEDMDKRYAINIIYKDINNKEISNEQLNIQIISILWELDCYLKEKGNLICRYTPKNIFYNIEKDNSFFTFNILLIGLSRVGKSTFINLLSGKLVALEADPMSSVTKNISEYYIYKDDDKKEHGAIKLIDTPGLVPNKKDLGYKKKLNEIIKLIKNNNIQSLEKKIHFIFFIIMKGSNFNDDNNEVLKALNESDIPFTFIINKFKKDLDINEEANRFKEYFNNNGFYNLSKDENFIGANFLKGDEGEVHGIDKIFTKISSFHKYLDKDLKSKIDGLLKDFRSDVQSNKSFLSYEYEDLKTITELKENINFEKRMNQIKEETKNNPFFSNLKIASIIDNGRQHGKKCKECILSLSNLKGIFPQIHKEFPAILFYQAFLVKEIGIGYGLDIHISYSGTKSLLKHVDRLFPILEKETNFEEKIKEINPLNVDEFDDVIYKKAKEEMEKSEDSILYLVKILDEIRKKAKNNKDEENFNFSHVLYQYSSICFEKELKDSEGLVFLSNYFRKLQIILDDINYYIDKKDWGNFKMAIKS